MSFVILIDGSSLLYSHFYATTSITYRKTKDASTLLKAPTGDPINGVYSMSKFINNLIYSYAPDYLLVAWDVKRSTLKRSKKYEDYKATRSKTDENIVKQIEIMQEVLESWGINQMRVEGYEADDIIGSVSKMFSGKKNEHGIPYEVKIISRDKDLLQLIDENISVWQNLPNLDRTYNIAGKKNGDQDVPRGYFEHNLNNFDKFYPGLTPNQIIDLKALEGDASDNIPGIRGIGEVTAKKLLTEFEDFEAIIEFAKSKSKKKFDDYCKEKGLFTRSPYNALLKYEEEGRLSKKLATIKTDLADIKEKNLDYFKLEINQEGKQEKFKELGFKTLLD